MFGDISLKDFILQWNLRFRFDRRWRKKYNIAFASKEHLQANPIDIYLDIQEDKVFKKFEEEYIEQLQNLEEYKKDGKWLKERKLSIEDENKIFEKLQKSFKNSE